MAKRKANAALEFLVENLQTWCDNHYRLVDECNELQNEEWLLKDKAKEMYKEADKIWAKYNDIKKKRQELEERCKKSLADMPRT